MRWLAWLLFCTTTCVAGDGGPLPEIKVGTSQREMVIHGPPRLPDGGMGQTFLVGTVTEVSAEEDRQPQRIKLSESCTLQVESAYGDLPQIAGIQTAVLRASYEQSPYALIEEDWGKLWHFKKGQRILVVLHLSEKELCFDPHELVILDGATATLPDVLRRTEPGSSRFVASDLKVLNAAGPQFHHRAVRVTQILARMNDEKAALLNQLVGVCVVLAALALLGADHYRRLQKPTT